MKFKNELIFICLILFILITTSAVSAVDNNTEIIKDNHDDILSIDNLNNAEFLTDENDGSFAALNEKINGDSSTSIVLDKNYTYSSTDTIKEGIVISKNNTVIDGQGHTIDAKGQSRIFNVTATTVILKDIKFINGFAVNGGAIRGYGENLRVINCTFVDNTASSRGGAIFSYPDSYAIYANSTFINNKANCGGAIATYYGFRHNIINCTFDSNHANDKGGAINILGQLRTEKYPYDDTINIRGCLFTNNNAANGSAISNMLSAYINMTDSIILGNPETVIYSWGAMFFAENNWWGNTVDDASIKPNITKQVTFSKWLYFDLVPNMDTSSATVSINNLYDSQTGETSVYSTSKLPSINVKFEATNATLDVNNADLSNSGRYELNFALKGNSILTANVNDVKVSKKIKVGGLMELALLIANSNDNIIKLDKDYVYMEGIDTKMGITISDKHDLVIDGNGHSLNGMGKSRLFVVDGGSSDITFKNMNIAGGYTNDGVDGAGAYILGDNTNFINCTFSNNIATGYGSGGSLHINSNNTKVIDCKFINNTHLNSAGGAISWNNGEAYIINSLFENNSADFTYAGALILKDGGDVINCTFIHNTAGHGGAIFNYNTLNVTDSTFIGNVALTDDYSYGGGAIYTPEANIINSVFIDNTASNGAAVYMTTSSVVVDQSTFINNTVTSYSGGVIFNGYQYGGGKVINSIFLNNNVGMGSIMISIYGGLEADYNWYGNTWKDYNSLPNMDNRANMTRWVFLNATDPILNAKNLQTGFTFLVYDSNTKMVVQYDIDDLPAVSLKLSGQNLTLKNDYSNVGQDISGTISYYKGNLIAEYETVKYVLPFHFQEKSYFIVNSTFDVYKDQSKYLGEVLYPFNDEYMPFLYSAGRITFTINDTSIFKFDKATDKITGLKVGLATITLKFDGKNVIGEDKYTPSNVTVLVNVTKAQTRIINSTSAPSDTFVGDNSNFVVSVVDSKNRSIRGATFEIINNNPDVLKLSVSGSNLQYKTLAEGLANITVKFAGNDQYESSSRDFTFQVGRKDPNIRLSDENISILASHDFLIGIFTYASDNFTYISNDTSVAIMDENGVHGIGDGVANITIRFGGDARYYPVDVYLIVNVNAVKTYIDLNQTKLMYLTDFEYINAAVMDSNGKLVGYATDFTSNDTNVVNISENCRLDAVGVGKAIVTVKFDGHYEYSPSTVEILVTVETATNNINVVSDVEIQVDQKTNLNATLDYGKGLYYESTNSSIVTVDSRGNIKGIKTGEAKIIITYLGTEKYDPSTKNVTVKVVKVPTSITAANSLAWIIGDNDTVVATLNPVNAGILSFKSNNESVVKIDSKGTVTAVGLGKTTIEISYNGSEKFEACNKSIEVNVYSTFIPTAIEVNESFELHVDDSIDMGAILNPANAGELTYVSSNENIVKVDNKTGIITAVKVGEADINITFAGNRAYLANSTIVHVKVSLIQTTINVNGTVSVNKTEEVPLNYVFSHSEAGQIKTSFKDVSIAHIENGKIIGDKVGKTILTLQFEGNSKYTASNATIEVIVTDVETTIDVSEVVEVNLTENTLINANLNPQVGKLKYIDYNKTLISIDANGKITGLKLGSTIVNIVFSGEGKYRQSNKTVTVVVKDVETTIVADDSIDLNVTETATIVANADPKEAGKLHFNTDSDIISIDDKGNIKGLKVGSATVVVSLDANGKYRQANKTITVNVCDVATDIKVDNDNINLVYKDETNINATLTPNDGKLTYSSNDTNVVTVDENGNVKAIKPGVATITVSYAGEGKYTPCEKNVTVTVGRAPSLINITDKINIEIGQGYPLKITTTPNKMNLTFTSTDNETVYVDSNRFIFANQKGSAIITIDFAGDEYYLPTSATINVTVNSRVTEIHVNKTIVIGYGEEMDLEAKLYYLAANSYMSGELIYVSSDKDIVKVDSEGKISALVIGNATINITYAGDKTFEPSSAIVNVEVTTRTTNIKTDASSVSLHVDDTYAIAAELLNGPNNAQLTYISNNPNIVRVNPLTGEMTALANGTAIVTVKYSGNDEYHSSSANISVTVSKYSTRINAQNAYGMNVYDELDLEASVTPNNGALTYASSDESIVTVSNGKLTAHKSGNAVITIKFEGDRKYLPSQKQVIVSVAKIPTSINLTDIQLNVGDTLKMENIVLPNGVPTRMKYYEFISWNTEIFDVVNGVLETYIDGSEELYVGFLGDDIYLPSNKTITVNVVKKVISASEYNFTIDVRDDLGEAIFTAILPEDVDGAFIVIIDGEAYGEYGNIIDGVATVTVDELAPGDHKVTLRYTGDEKYRSITNNTVIHLGKYKLDKNTDKSVLYTSKSTVVYTVHLTKDTQAMEGKRIKVTFNGKKYYAYTDYLGYASVKVKLPAVPKTYKITAQFSSVKVTNKVTIKSIVVAKNLVVKKSAKSVKIKVSLKKVNKKYLKGKKITLKFNGKKFTAKTNKKGVATFTIKKNVYAKLKVGKKYTYKVTYLKDTVSKKITIKK